MNDNQATIETDAHMLGGSYSFDVEFARRLERERDEARAQLYRICKEGFDNQDTIGLEPADDYVLRKLAEMREVIKQCHSCVSLFLGWHSRDLGMDHLRYVSETLAKCANQLTRSAPATSQEKT